MKTNTFYKPKNEYNELLASQLYVNDADDKLRKDFTIEINRVDGDIKAEIENREEAIADEAKTREEEDSKLHAKIETFNTIKVKWINDERGTDKFDSIDDYFFSVLSRITTEAEREQFKVELGQTIYIIEGKDDPENTFEEWVCHYPNNNFDTNNLPKMIRLGAVDSILARSIAPGTVKLVHEIYESTKNLPNNFESVKDYWAQFYVEKVNEDGSIKKVPARGLAVAPCALKAFVDRDNAIKNELNSEIERLEDADKEIYKRIGAEVEKLEGADSIICERLNKIEAEIEGSTLDDEQGFQDTRLDKIEAAIGMNHHHCDNCGCGHDQCSDHDSCSCSDATNKCTIYCRLNDAESDLEELNINIDNLDKNLKDEVTRLDELIETIEAERIAADSNIQEQINDLVREDANLHEQINGLQRSLSEEVSLRDEADKTIWSEIGESVNPNDGTIWKEIKEIQKGIGSQDAPYEDTIWQRINKNKLELDEEISDLKITADAHEKDISVLGMSVSNIITEIGTKSPTDITIWGGIHSEINARRDADEGLLKNIEEAISETKIYAEDVAKAAQEAAEITAAKDATNKAKKAKEDAIAAAAEDTDKKIGDAKTEVNNYTNTTVDNLASSLEDKMATLKEVCENYTDLVADETLEDAKTHTDNEIKDAKDDIIAIAANDALDKANNAKTAAILVATENAKNHTKNEILDFYGKVTTDINIAKNELRFAIDSKLDESDFNNKESEFTSRIENLGSQIKNLETIINLKASATDISETAVKIENIEHDLENLSHEFHHLTSQTQFAVRTNLPGTGSKVIQVYNLIGPASNEWDLVTITTVTANNETIYPEIAYNGEIEEGKNDNRQVSITFEHGGDENLPVTLIVSAVKASEEHIIEID